LFDHELERVLPRAELLKMHDVWASSDGFLFKGGRVLPESFAFPFLQTDGRARGAIKFLARNYLLRERRKFEPGAAWIVDNWSHGYFHWLADALTRLYVIKEFARDLVLLLPHRYAALHFVQPSLKAFGVREVKFIGRDEVFLCRNLFVPTHTAPPGNHDAGVINGVRDLLLAEYGGDTGAGGERIYISRGRARRRKIVNEEEVVAALREFDFRVIHAEDHSFGEQVRIASRASYLVSNHGAGLTNMLFMPAGASVLELRHEADRVNNCYFTLASVARLNYFYQTCEPETPGEDAHTANLRVDVATLKANVKLVLGM
jgi:capsular polysaccharide biosynthesis protein